MSNPITLTFNFESEEELLDFTKRIALLNSNFTFWFDVERELRDDYKYDTPSFLTKDLEFSPHVKTEILERLRAKIAESNILDAYS